MDGAGGGKREREGITKRSRVWWFDPPALLVDESLRQDGTNCVERIGWCAVRGEVGPAVVVGISFEEPSVGQQHLGRQDTQVSLYPCAHI